MIGLPYQINKRDYIGIAIKEGKKALCCIRYNCEIFYNDQKLFISIFKTYFYYLIGNKELW